MLYAERPECIEDLLYTDYSKNQWWVFNKRKYVIDNIIKLLVLRSDNYEEYKLETKGIGIFDTDPLRFVKNEEFMLILKSSADYFGLKSIDDLIMSPVTLEMKKIFIDHLIEETIWDHIIWKNPASLICKTSDTNLSGRKSEYLVFDIADLDLRLIWNHYIGQEECHLITPNITNEILNQKKHFEDAELLMLKDLYDSISAKIKIKGVRILSIYAWTDAWGIKR